MNLLWLDDFLALATAGNFSRAAELRHMTQPAFSRRIRALEEWLGVVLVDRGSHPVTLTEAGEWFRDEAQQILARVARVPDAARAVADAASATLRLASTHALSFTFLPRWLGALEANTPLGPVQLISDVAPQCEQLLRQGRVQFLLCHWHAGAPGGLDPAQHAARCVGSDRLVPVSAPGVRGAPRYRLPADAGTAAAPPDAGHRDPAALPLLSYSAESGLGRIVRAVLGGRLEQAGAEPVFTAHLASVLKTLAVEGRGVAWLPLALVGDDLASGRLVEAGGPGWQIEVELRLFRAAGVLPRAAEAFWRAVVDR